MKKIRIRFLGTGYENYYQVNVKIYDKCNRLVYKGCTYNGVLCVCLKECECYTLCAYLGSRFLKKCICIDNRTNCYEFAFSYCCPRRVNPENFITFSLTDYNYNLPVERGKLRLNGKRSYNY